jgi:hypothetical protein
VLLVFGFGGQAMAAFELGNFHLVAYEEVDQAVPVGNLGNEIHYDLGAGLPAIPPSVDTGITLADFGVSSWDQVYVGIAGGGYTPSFGNDRAYFSSDTGDLTVSANTYSQFQSASLNISSFFTGSIDIVQPKASGTWYNNMIGGGFAPGTYAAMVNANSPFGAEAQLVNDGFVEVGIYSFDGVDVGTLRQDAAWRLDTSSGSLVINPVPIPGAVFLLGSLLLGALGLRRRKA